MTENRKSRRIAWCVICGALTVIIVTFALYRMELIDLYRMYQVGYRFVWMPEGVLPSRHEVGHKINTSGEVAVDLRGLQRAGRWTTGEEEVTILPAPLSDGEYSLSSAINERGCVVGNSSRGGNRDRHAYVWAPGSAAQDIGNLGGLIVPTDINGLNQIVAAYQRALNEVSRQLLTRLAETCTRTKPEI